MRASKQCYGNTSGLVSLVLLEPSWGSDRGSQLSVLFVALPPPTKLLIGWINLEGNLTRSRIPPKLTIGVVFYICPQERQMLSPSTTSAFEYPYLDTMRGNTKGIYFGGQGRCIILAVKMDCGRLVKLLKCIDFN